VADAPPPPPGAGAPPPPPPGGGFPGSAPPPGGGFPGAAPPPPPGGQYGQYGQPQYGGPGGPGGPGGYGGMMQPFSVGGAISYGWNGFKSNAGAWIGMLLLGVLVSGIVNAILNPSMRTT